MLGGTVAVPGLIDAGGGGGSPGSSFIDFVASAGGGAGGNVVMEGLMVRVTGELYANGGGGGAGFGDGVGGGGGADGRRATAGAPGGVNGVEGAGGSGGSRDQPPGPGQLPANEFGRSGAGGGSVGYFQTYTPNGVTPLLTPFAASPALQPNLTIPIK